MTRLTMPWPIRSTLAGTAGTGAMTAVRDRATPPAEPSRLAGLRRLARAGQDRRVHHACGQGDEQVGKRDRACTELELRLGLRHLARSAAPARVREPWASALFGVTLMSATCSIFPHSDGRPRPGAGRPT
jgi:hypothetical protein